MHTGITKKLHKVWEWISESSERPWAGICLALSATVFASVGQFFAQIAINSGEGVPNLEVVIIRCMEQAIIMYLILICTKSRILFGRENWLHLWFMSCACYAGYILLYFALSNIPLSVALTLAATCPFWATLFSICILKEPFNCLETICGMTSFTGVVLIARPRFIFGNLGKKEPIYYKNSNTSIKTYQLIYLTGCLLALFYGMGKAMYLVLIRKWGKENKETSQMVTVFYPSILGVIFTPYLVFFTNDELVIPREMYERCSLFSVGLLTSIELLCITLSLKSQNATVISLIRNVEIVWAFLLEYMVLGRIPSWWSVGGAALIITMTLIVPVRDSIMAKLKAKGEVIYNSDEVELINAEDCDDNEVENTVKE